MLMMRPLTRQESAKTMKNKIARIAFAAAFGGSGIAHFLTPKLFIALLPRVVPWRKFWVYASGVVEIGVALGLLTPAGRKPAARGVLGLLLLFTPLHVYDIFRDKPIAGGTKTTAVLRLLAQFGLIKLAGDLVAEDRD